MYSRKFHQSFLQAKPNLRNVILEANISTKRFYQYSFYIQKFTTADAYKTLQSVQVKLKGFLKNDKIYNIIKNSVIGVPQNLKDQSSKILRIWAHQCECVVAQRLRRSQQMFCLYSKLWEEHALKEFIHNMRQQVTRHSKHFIMGSVIYGVSWNSIRISDVDMLQHVNELDYISKLRSMTVKCPDCENRNLALCTCPTNKDEVLNYDNWTLFIEKDELLVWRRPNSSGSFEYKVYGAYDDVTAEDFLNVQVDISYRKYWDATAIQLEVVEKDPELRNNSAIIYWEMLWPRLFTNRDYVFQRRYMVDHSTKTLLIVNKSTEHPLYPTKSDKYRIKDYWSYMVIKSTSSDFKKPGIEFGLTYYDNPGVNIPAPVTAWVAMRAMPDFLENLRLAAKKYAAYCQETGHTCICSIISEEKCELDESKTKKGPMCPTEDSPCINPNRIGCVPGAEVMTSPMTQHDTSRKNSWKYLQSSFSVS